MMCLFFQWILLATFKLDFLFVISYLLIYFIYLLEKFNFFESLILFRMLYAKL